MIFTGTSWAVSWGVFVVALLTTVLSAARLTRLIVNDSWPPVLWVKGKWDAWTDRSPRRQAWWLLLQCPWCLSPWMTLLVGAWGVLSHLHWTWWAFNGWLALAYLAGMVVFHDEGKPDPE